MTTQEWWEFLQRWNDQWLATDQKFPARIRKSRWLGRPPAAGKQILKLEKRLGYELPPSYRNFLLVSNGWSHTTLFIKCIRPASKVEWLEIDNPQMLDASSVIDPDLFSMANYPPEEYFAYDQRPIFDLEHLRKSLVIADPIDGDSMIYVLNPQVVAEDGEWEAWRHAHWIPGAERFPSFALLMQAEYQSFLAANGQTSETMHGPYTGPYSPDRPRHAAKPIGPGRRKPLRPTIPQLIAQLESPTRQARLAAANQLFLEAWPHNPQDEHPEIVEPLSRILRSQLESEVRGAAATMLGSFGDSSAIPLLLNALNDPRIVGAAVGALSSLTMYMEDSRVADALVHLLETPQSQFVTGTAIRILEELQDPRVAAIGLRILDTHADRLTQFEGALVFVKFAPDAAEQLLARLSHANPEIRANATAALRQVKNKGPHLIPIVTPLLNDPDPAVKFQACLTLKSLDASTNDGLPPEVYARAAELAEVFVKRVRERRGRF